MSTARITRESIFKAADDLVAAGAVPPGQVPTLAAVRAAVGGGSFTTISEAMKEWRSIHTAKAAAPTVIREPAPDFLTARVEALASDLWSAATEKADEKLQSEREAMAQVRDELEDQKKEAAELADQMEADLQRERDNSAAQGVELENLRADIERLSSQLSCETAFRVSAESRANTAEAALSEAHAAIEAAKVSADRAAADLLAERQARSQAESDARAKAGEVGALEGRLAAERERASDLSLKLSALESQHRDTLAVAAKGTAEAASSGAELARMGDELARLRAELVEARGEAKASAAEAAELRGKLSAVQSQTRPA